jgi:hypothetical protein
MTNFTGFAVPEAVTLPVGGWPNRFPSDAYLLYMTPAISLPEGVFLSTGGGGESFYVPANVIITADPSLGDYTLTATEVGANNRLIIGIVIGRSLVYQLTIYIVALLPLLLGGVVVHIWLRRRQPVFDLGFIAGLIAAMLAILPLRAVLIPADLSTAGLTRVDDILVLGVLLISALVFAQYARIVTTRPMRSQHPQSDAEPDDTGTPESSAKE